MIRPFYVFVRFVAWAACVVYFRLRRRGIRNVPAEGSVVFVVNHASYLDPPFVGATAPRRVRFLARSSLYRVPILGQSIRWLGTLPIERDGHPREGLQACIDCLLAGETVCMFPEGTRSRDGRVGPFKRGLLLLLRRAPATVVPTGVVGSFRALPRGARVPRPFGCEVRYGEPMSAAEVLAPGGLEELRRRVLALVGQPPESSIETEDEHRRTARERGGAALACSSVAPQRGGFVADPTGWSPSGVATFEPVSRAPRELRDWSSDTVPVAVP